MALSLPALASQVPGNFITSATWNANVYTPLSFLLNRPVFRGVQAAAQSIPNTTVTPVAIDTTVIDTYGGHSNTVNNSRYTAQIAGWYLLIGSVGMGTSSSGARLARLHKNGSLIAASQFGIPNPSWDITTAIQTLAIVQLAVGDYVEVAAYQASGGALTTNGDCALTVLWIHA
ncbi:hypothetical protein [Streptomyces sp. NRRL S-350]|uniref:hypothetical protein n=1 Tax=Streptomyces sp. NRRL S-350 TaxID=1463902 RepID=UPI0004C2648E|nr:hypothetical protein [Streptomyces sp. NRRL S-350]